MFHYKENTKSGEINENLFADGFFKDLLSFMNESDDSSTSSGYASEIFSVNNVVASGNLDSFSGKQYGDLIYRRCNFSNRLYSSWTNSSAGLKSSPRESKSIPSTLISSSNNKTEQYSPLSQNLKNSATISAATVQDKTAFFTKYLRNSLLRGLENHPESLKHIPEEIQQIHLQTRRQLKPSVSISSKENSSSSTESRLNKFVSSTQTKIWRVCRFCLKNGEPEIVYTGHFLKALDGTVSCPILKRYVCDICGATGQFSHTRKYCPKYKEVVMPPEFRKLASGIIAVNLNHK